MYVPFDQLLLCTEVVKMLTLYKIAIDWSHSIGLNGKIGNLMLLSIDQFLLHVDPFK